MYSAYKLNNQGDDIQPWCTPWCTQSVVPCLILTAASWPTYSFLRRLVRWSGIPISLRIFHSLLWSTQRLWHSHCSRSGSFSGIILLFWWSSGCWQFYLSAFSKSSLNIWKFSAHVLLKPSLENFEHCFASVWNECNCAVVWTFFGISFLWDRTENWPFPVPWPLLSFPNLLAYWVQHFKSSIF